MKSNLKTSDSGAFEVTFQHFTRDQKKIKDISGEDEIITYYEKVLSEFGGVIKPKELTTKRVGLSRLEGTYYLFKDHPFTLCTITYNYKNKIKTTTGFASLVTDRVITDVRGGKKTYKRKTITLSKASGRKIALGEALKSLRPQVGNDVCNEIRSLYYKNLDTGKSINDIIIKNLKKILTPYLDQDLTTSIIDNYRDCFPKISPGEFARLEEKVRKSSSLKNIKDTVTIKDAIIEISDETIPQKLEDFFSEKKSSSLAPGITSESDQNRRS